jgi:addiction module HigA family antidote
MRTTKRKPSSVGEILVEEFLLPLKITQGQLAVALGISRRTVNELCNNKRMITIDTALMLSRALGTTPEFWLNLQQQNDLWAALNNPRRIAKIKRVHRVAA